MQQKPTFTVNKNNSSAYEISNFMEDQKTSRDSTKQAYNALVEDIITNKMVNLIKAIESSTTMTD